MSAVALTEEESQINNKLVWDSLHKGCIFYAYIKGIQHVFFFVSKTENTARVVRLNSSNINEDIFTGLFISMDETILYSDLSCLHILIKGE